MYDCHGLPRSISCLAIPKASYTARACFALKTPAVGHQRLRRAVPLHSCVQSRDLGGEVLLTTAQCL